jgi:hypothetical protein
MRNLFAATLALALLLTAAIGDADAAPPDPATALPDAAALAPLARAAPIERHTPDTLWERIDGEAEIYKSYGLAASAHARYEDPKDPDRRIELSAFSFADPLGAFGIFAAFRPSSCDGRGHGNGGCLGDYQGFFWQGGLFVLADASGPAATRPADVRRALDAAASLLGSAPEPPAPLPEFLRLATGARYQPQHLLGRAALPPGLEGNAGGTFAFRATAAADLDAARAWLEAYGAVLEKPESGSREGRRYLAGIDPALGPVVLLAGERGISGARSTPDKPGVWELLMKLSPLAGPPAAGKR